SGVRGSPVRAGLATFVAFVTAGAVPLLASLPELVAPRAAPAPLAGSPLPAGLAFFPGPALDGRLVRRSAVLSGLEALRVGTLLAGLAFFAVGALKGRFVRRSAVLSGLETLLVGGLAAIAAYGIGWSLERVAGTG